jgi:PTS system galactitol-specific IIC component
MPGVSIPHGNAIVFAPVGMFVEFVINRIPGLRKIDFSAASVQKRFGRLVEPSLLGFFLGVVFGIVAGQPSGQVMMTGATVAAFMILFPKMLSTLIEGITPVAEGMRSFSQKYLKRDIHIGLDAGVLIGQPEVLSTGILLVPIVLLLAFILPGNRVLPLADLAIATPFLITACMPYHKGNMFRGLVSGILVFAIALLITTNLAPINSWVGIENGTPIVESGLWTSVGGLSSPFSWVIIKLFQLISGFSIPG